MPQDISLRILSQNLYGQIGVMQDIAGICREFCVVELPEI
jgi:hypothetical protein